MKLIVTKRIWGNQSEKMLQIVKLMTLDISCKSLFVIKPI